MNKQQPRDVTRPWQIPGGRPTLPMHSDDLARLRTALTTPDTGTIDVVDISTGKQIADRTRAVHLSGELDESDYPSGGFESPGDLMQDVRIKVDSMWNADKSAQAGGNDRGVMLARDEYDQAIDAIDPEASTRSIREFVLLLANLDERLDVNGKQNDQIRMILDELKPYLQLLRQEMRRKVFQAYPVLFYPDQILPSLEGLYPRDEEVLPGLSKFELAVRELGKALSFVFKRETFSVGIEKLVALKEKKYEYVFQDFRDTLVRMDDEPPQYTEELRFWLMMLSREEKRAIGEFWTPPARPENIVQHLQSRYPEAWHNYVLQVFGERLNSLFAHSSIPDNAAVRGGFERQGISPWLIGEARNIAQLWRGELPITDSPPKRITGRITDRVNKVKEGPEKSHSKTYE